MTLCVAWNTGTNIYFASDSRISNIDKFSDYGIKIVPVPIKIFSPSESETGKTKIAFEKTYGMCFAGSFTGAYIVREFLIATLQRLQYVPRYIEISFAQICHIVNKFYNHLIQEIYSDLKCDHSIDFFFSGYCPKERELKIAKFFIKYSGDYNSFCPKYEFIEDKNFVEPIGEGSDQFKLNFDILQGKYNRSLRVLNAIKMTIDQQKVPSVGGNIQYGDFDDMFEFITSGITDRTYNERGLLKEVKFCIAGINMHGNEFDQKDSELFVMGGFIDPFKKQSS